MVGHIGKHIFHQQFSAFRRPCQSTYSETRPLLNFTVSRSLTPVWCYSLLCRTPNSFDPYSLCAAPLKDSPICGAGSIKTFEARGAGLVALPFECESQNHNRKASSITNLKRGLMKFKYMRANKIKAVKRKFYTCRPLQMWQRMIPGMTLNMVIQVPTYKCNGVQICLMRLRPYFRSYLG